MQHPRRSQILGCHPSGLLFPFPDIPLRFLYEILGELPCIIRPAVIPLEAVPVNHAPSPQRLTFFSADPVIDNQVVMQPFSAVLRCVDVLQLQAFLSVELLQSPQEIPDLLLSRFIVRLLPICEGDVKVVPFEIGQNDPAQLLRSSSFIHCCHVLRSPFPVWGSVFLPAQPPGEILLHLAIARGYKNFFTISHGPPSEN